MRRPPLLALAPLLLVIHAAAARAEPTGTALSVVERCDADLTILPAPGLSGTVRLHGEVHSSGRRADGAIEVEPGCRDGVPLVIEVPTDFPVTVDVVGGGALRLGDLQGRIAITRAGGGDTVAGHLGGDLVLSIRGSGDVAITSDTGRKLAVDLVGGGDVTIAAVDTDLVAIQGRGSGDVSIGPGRIGNLAAELAGSGDLAVRATVGNGAVRSMGSADISIARVTGHLDRSTAGSGSIRVAEDGSAGAGDSFVMPPMPPIPPMPPMPPMPAMPIIDPPSIHWSDGSHRAERHRRHADDGSSSTGTTLPAIVTPILALGAVGIVGTLAWRRRTSIVAGLRTSGAPGASDNQAIAALALRLDALARRTGRIETWVTTREFELHRDFREIGDD